jgi:hypothetical protein
MAAKKAASPPPRGKKLANAEVMVRLASRGEDIVAAPVRDLVQAAAGRGPASHRYRAGQTVTLAPNRYGPNRHGRFEVTRLLPEEHGINQYRLKSVVDGHERVAREDELL